MTSMRRIRPVSRSLTRADPSGAGVRPQGLTRPRAGSLLTVTVGAAADGVAGGGAAGVAAGEQDTVRRVSRPAPAITWNVTLSLCGER